jgi:hypothetical protein
MRHRLSFVAQLARNPYFAQNARKRRKAHTCVISRLESELRRRGHWRTLEAINRGHQPFPQGSFYLGIRRARSPHTGNRVASLV